ncbi:MAG TPA: STAS domain-containing protein [Polyangiales bacterium]|nr:STAS domain-containing protein [Polyangiales bacterium]
MAETESRLPQLIERHHAQLLEEWVAQQSTALTRRRDLITDAELREQSSVVLQAIRAAAKTNLEIDSVAWKPVRDVLADITRSRARHGFSPSETATFVFSLKQPLMKQLRAEYDNSLEQFVDQNWIATQLLDGLGLYTTEIFQRTREEVIARQQSEMLELSTPVVELWHGILALPLIGTLDSRRTQTVMETLLERIVETGSQMAIIDITGVPTVDTLTAQHLLRTITATRLMGADCIISGVRPQIAQTIVHLGVDLGDVMTKASLSSALELALRRRGLSVQKRVRTKVAE